MRPSAWRTADAVAHHPAALPRLRDAISERGGPKAIGSALRRRRVERFAQRVDEATGGRRHRTRSTVDESLADLVSISRRLVELPVRVEAQQEFRDGLRAMLLATAERVGIGVTAEEPVP